MSKIVISVRLSRERLCQLDAAAEQLRMSRSEAIDAALRILPDLISGTCELSYKVKPPSKKKRKLADDRTQ
jgi:hypothetical protein